MISSIQSVKIQPKCGLASGVIAPFDAVKPWHLCCFSRLATWLGNRPRFRLAEVEGWLQARKPIRNCVNLAEGSVAACDRRIEQRSVMTVKTYIEDHCIPEFVNKRKPGTRRGYLQILRAPVLPALGAKERAGGMGERLKPAVLKTVLPSLSSMQSIENTGHPRFLFALFCQVLVPNVAVNLGGKGGHTSTLSRGSQGRRLGRRVVLIKSCAVSSPT